jgi:hypothetical protein
MKKNNLQKFERLDRAAMREIMAGNVPSLTDGQATVTCNDGTDHPVSSCDEPEMTRACKNHKDWKICSGGN